MDYQSWIDQQEGVESRQQEISARQVKSAELEARVGTHSNFLNWKKERKLCFPIFKKTY